MTELPKAFSPEQFAEMLSDAGRAEMAKPALIDGDRSAEITTGTPAWYVVETYGQCERSVADELVARRFGIFVPEIEETVVRRGRMIDRKALMFTRYIFVFTWLNDQNYSLIKNTKDVFRFIATAEGNKPLVVTDEEIDMLRRMENRKRPFTVVFDDNEPPAFLSKKARTRWKPRVFNAKRDILRVRAWSAFDDGFTALDSAQRNQTLEKALGLAPSTCP